MAKKKADAADARSEIKHVPSKADIVELAESVANWVTFIVRIPTRIQRGVEGYSIENSNRRIACQSVVSKLLDTRRFIGLEILNCDDDLFEWYFANALKTWQSWSDYELHLIADVLGYARSLSRIPIPFDSIVMEELLEGLNRTATLRTIATFVPRELQGWILGALDGRSMTADELIAELKVSRDTLYGGKTRIGGLAELKELGLVVSRTKGGYFRPDAPPK